jgi:hypothetical protein
LVSLTVKAAEGFVHRHPAGQAVVKRAGEQVGLPERIADACPRDRVGVTAGVSHEDPPGALRPP